MKVAIYSRGLDFEQENPIQLLLEELMRYDTTIFIFSTLLEQYHFDPHICQKLIPFSVSEQLTEDIDILISLGGDGTMLDAVTLVNNKNIPLLGINFGRLGFLASISRDELSIAVDALIKQNCNDDDNDNDDIFGNKGTEIQGKDKIILLTKIKQYKNLFQKELSKFRIKKTRM